LAQFWWAGAAPNEGGDGERAWPCQKPPWGQLVAVNAASGDIAWVVLSASPSNYPRPNGGPAA
jgi:hypothetical protein